MVRERVLPPSAGEQLAVVAGARYVEASARSNVNVALVFHEVVRQMRLHPTADMRERERRRKARRPKCVFL